MKWLIGLLYLMLLLTACQTSPASDPMEIESNNNLSPAIPPHSEEPPHSIPQQESTNSFPGHPDVSHNLSLDQQQIFTLAWNTWIDSQYLEDSTTILTSQDWKILNSIFSTSNPLLRYIRLKRIWEQNNYPEPIQYLLQVALLRWSLELKFPQDTLQLDDEQLWPHLTFHAKITLAEFYFYQNSNSTVARRLLSTIPRLFSMVPSFVLSLSHRLMIRELMITRFPLALWGLTDPSVAVLFLDNEDLWVGTWNGGLARFSLSTYQVELFFPGEYTQLETGIRDIQKMDHRILVLRPDRLLQFSKISNQWTSFPLNSEIIEDRPQKLTIFQNHLILLGTKKIWHWNHQHWEILYESSTLDFQTASATEQYLDVWLGNQTIISWNNSKFLNHQLEIISPSPGVVTNIIRQQDQSLTLTTHQNGLWKIFGSPMNRKVEKHYNSLWTTGYHKHEKFEFISTMGQGLFILPNSTSYQLSEMNQMVSDEIVDLKVHGNWLILGTMDSGLLFLPKDML